MKRSHLLLICLIICSIGIVFVPHLLQHRVLASQRFQWNGENVVQQLVEDDGESRRWHMKTGLGRRDGSPLFRWVKRTTSVERIRKSNLIDRAVVIG